MPVNNTVYNQVGQNWWKDDAEFEIASLRYSVNPVRHSYFARELARLSLPGKALLDVGCGGGFLAEAFAKDGYHVTGIDPAEALIDAAKEHADRVGLSIDYRIGRGERLPFLDAAFDVVACCDVLEHVDAPPEAIREAARVLRPGGVFLFDTINRTWKSKLLLKLYEDWTPANHDWSNAHVFEKFITPDEFTAMLTPAKLTPCSMRGIGSSRHPLRAMYDLFRIRTKGIRGEAVGKAFPMRETGDLGAAYMGWARKL